MPQETDGTLGSGQSSLASGLVTTFAKLEDPVSAALRPDWFALTDAMPAPTTPAANAPIDPLFVPRWTRAIVSGSLSVRSPDGPLDVERIVDQLARLMPIGMMPRLPWPTTRFGALVLIDIGDAMMPWSRDIPQLRDAIVAVIGRDRCKILQFDGCPSRGAGKGIRPTWKVYEAPAPSTPVVVLSDLGVGRPAMALSRATSAEWLRFAEDARRAGTPLIAFVPYPADRVHAAIRRAMTVVPWDRSTSNRDIHRWVGRGLQVTRE